MEMFWKETSNTLRMDKMDGNMPANHLKLVQRM